MSRPKTQTLRTLVPRPSGMRPVVEPPQDPAPETGGAIRRWLHGALFDNVGLKFLSMVLAVTVFLLVTIARSRSS